MNRQLWVAMPAIACIGIALPAIAQDPVIIERLRQTKTCQNCNLSNADLSGIDLSGANLQGTNLSNVNLSGSDLSSANLIGTNLYLANLRDSNLQGAQFIKANWTGANGEQVNLAGADLSGAMMRYVNLTGADLTGANLTNANLSDATLVGTSFNAANLTNTNFDFADLSNATFAQATIDGTRLNNANLAGAQLQDADFTSATLTGAQLEQASLPPDIPPSAATSDTLITASAKGDYTLSPLQRPPIRLFNLETANHLNRGDLLLVPGTRLFFSRDEGSGAGLQLNTGMVYGGFTDNLQLGLTGDLYDDPVPKRVNGAVSNLVWVGGGLSGKYKLLDGDRWDVSLNASVEGLRITRDGGLFRRRARAGSSSSNLLIGSVQMPITYSVTPKFQAHFLPAVSVFPESIEGSDFYDTIFSVGAGLSWSPIERISLFGDVQMPIGPGDNAIRRRDSSPFKVPVWSAGVRFLVNPAVGLDIYGTNAFGITPATQILASIPDGDTPAIAVNLNFAPDIGQNYDPTYRPEPLQELSDRDQQLLLDGFTIPAADTLLPRTLRARVGVGEGVGFNVATSLTHDVQIELFGEDLSEGIDLTSRDYGSSFKFGASAKIRVLDQIQGDPFTFSVKGSLAQSIAEPFGYSSGEAIFQYRPISALALTLNPRVAILRSNTLAGIGLGVNYQIWNGLQVIGEVTPLLTGESTVWSAGIRYLEPRTKLGIGVYGGNAVGPSGFGGLIAQPDPVIGVNVHWLFGGP